MPILFHPDIKSQYFQANYLRQGVFNIYQFISQNKEKLSYQDTFNYPPLAYYFFGSWNYLTAPLLGQPYQNWLSDWSEEGFVSGQVFRTMFILKIPYLLADLLIGLLLIKLLEEKFREKALLIWFFNPLTLYIIYGLSNFDVIPTALTLLAVFYFRKKNYFVSGLSLGLGIAMKLFPLLFLPFFLLPLLRLRMYRPAFLFMVGAAGIFLLSVSWLWQSFLGISQSGLITKVLELKISLPLVSAVPVFYLFYGLLLLAVLKKDAARMEFFLLAVTLLIPAVSRFHPQWLLWALPFLVIFAAKDMKILLLSGLLFLSFIPLVLGFEDRFLTLGLLGPLFPAIYNTGFLERTLFSIIDQSGTIFWGQVSFALAAALIAVVCWRKEKASAGV